MGAKSKLSFEAFAAGCGYALTAAQAEFARVAYDGERPSDESEAKQLWGADSSDAREWRPLPAAKKTVAAVCGRGSGKSLLGGLRILQLAMTVDISKLGKREVAFCPVVAPDLDTAQQVVRFALGAAEALGVPFYTAKHHPKGDDGFTIKRAGNRLVRIEARSASAKGRSIRGRSMPGAVLDECAFFYDEQHRVNDVGIFDALKPRIMAGGQIIILSSPWSASGLLYDLWKRNYNHPMDALVAHAPTGLMRSDNVELLETIAADRAVDPEKASREYDASFMTAGANTFFDPRAIADALERGKDLGLTKRPGATIAVGGDFAFKRNSSAAVACELAEGKVSVTGLLEMRPTAAALKPSTVAKRAAEFTKEAGTDIMVADSHYREAVAEHLSDGGVSLAFAPEGNSGKTDTYQTARFLLHEGLLILPPEDSSPEAGRLVRQLREVTYRPLSGGGMSFDSPLWRTGEHGDLVSAFILASWRAWKLGWTPTERAPENAPDEIERRLMAEDQEAAARAGRGMLDQSHTGQQVARGLGLGDSFFR